MKCWNAVDKRLKQQLKHHYGLEFRRFEVFSFWARTENFDLELDKKLQK